MSPIQITVRDMSASPTLETIIRKKAEKLSHYYDRICSCRVVVEQSQKHKHQGKLYNVRVDVFVPGKELVSTRKCDQDVYIALRDAFRALCRQLEEHSRKRHGRVKAHNHTLHGYVSRLIPSEGYGFIEGTDGNEYYFSVTNVAHPAFAKLAIGDHVEYVGESLNDGRQAQHVLKERKNNHIVREETMY